jgi:hypothetical protein
MRVETSALDTLKKRLRNMMTLMRMAKGVTPWRAILGEGARAVLSDGATSCVRSETVWEPVSGRRVLYVSMRNEATMDENRPVWHEMVRRAERPT